MSKDDAVGALQQQGAHEDTTHVLPRCQARENTRAPKQSISFQEKETAPPHRSNTTPLCAPAGFQSHHEDYFTLN